jgi:hypothetical protein
MPVQVWQAHGVLLAVFSGFEGRFGAFALINHDASAATVGHAQNLAFGKSAQVLEGGLERGLKPRVNLATIGGVVAVKSKQGQVFKYATVHEPTEIIAVIKVCVLPFFFAGPLAACAACGAVFHGDGAPDSGDRHGHAQGVNDREIGGEGRVKITALARAYVCRR